MGRYRLAGVLLALYFAGGTLAFLPVERNGQCHPDLCRRSKFERPLNAQFNHPKSSSISLQGAKDATNGAAQHSLGRLRENRNHPQSSSLVALQATTTDDATNGTEPSSSGDDDKNSTTAKHILTKGYSAGRYIFGAASALILAIPDRTMTTLLATKLGGSAGFALAAGLCHILQGATSHDRLTSDTYKRLNVGLLGFCGMGLVAVPAEAAFMNSAINALAVSFLLTGVKLYGTALALVGWKQGVLNDGAVITFAPKRMFQELVDGTRETAKGLKVQSSKKALTYRNCLLLVCVGIVSSFMEGLFNIRYQKEFTRTWFEISLQWSAVSRLFMISTMVYSLKDAAERDRLTGTTFIQLNILIGIWAVAVGLGQAIYPLGFAAYRGVEMFAFSFPFFLKAFKSVKEKSEAKKEKS